MPTIHPINLTLTQVAVIAVPCCAGHICMVSGGGGSRCMLLLHPIPTVALMLAQTFAPYTCGVSLLSTDACTGNGYHQLQLALMVLLYIYIYIYIYRIG